MLEQWRGGPPGCHGRVAAAAVAAAAVLTHLAGAADDPPLRTAPAGRLQLVVPTEAPPLGEVRVSAGEAGPATWLDDPAQRARLTDVQFPIDWWRWRELRLAFTPAHDGPVELRLLGPWAEAAPGREFRQEVLWDDLAAAGATIENGDFHRTGPAAPAGWTSPWRPYPGPDQWPLDGGATGAAWHGRPLAQALTVRAGRAVRLRLRARAAVPPGLVVPRRLGAGTPAHRVCGRLGRGVNLGNGWEAPPGSWSVGYGVADVERIAAAGFGHIRVPVAWHYRLREGTIMPEFFAELEPVLRRALECKLQVILNWHHFEDLCVQPEGNRAQFVRGWQAIARHFANWPPALLFELLNEPHAPLEGELLNGIHAEAIAVIRTTNPARTLLVNPSQWATVGMLGPLRLPDGDANLIVSVHCYEPFQFTHQDAGWVGLTGLKGIVFPGPPERRFELPGALAGRGGLAAWVDAYNRLPTADNPASARAFEILLDDALAWSEYFGRPVHLGEFGAHRAGDPASRERYARAVRAACEQRGIPWCWWEWKAGFACWDADANQPLVRPLFGPGMAGNRERRR
jgi:endoglucanase